MKDSFKQLFEIAKMILPKGKIEWLLFALLSVLYFSYSLFFLFNTGLIDHPYMHIDMYFSFDNTLIFHNGVSGVDAHPFLRVFTYPFIFVSSILMKLDYKCKGLFLLICTNFLTTLSSIYVYRYLKIILGIDKYMLYLLTIFFACFSTNLVLCFTTESFTISLFLTSFVIYYYSSMIYNKKEVRLGTLIVFSFAMGGTTVTNFAKGGIPYLFLDMPWRKKLERLFIVGLFFFIALLAVEYAEDFNYIERIGWRQSFTEATKYTGAYYEKAIDLFLGTPVLFSQLVEGIKDSSDVFPGSIPRETIELDFYRHALQYVWLALFYSCMLVGIVTNYKNKLVQMLVAMFAFDVLLHVVVGYGLGESFIYGGHWVSIFPLLLGWAYVRLRNNQNQIFTYLISCLFLVLVINNLHGIYKLYSMGVVYYPSIPM